VRQLEGDDVPPDCQPLELSQNEPVLCLFHVIVGVVPEAPAQSDNGRQSHFVHYLFDSLRGPSQHDRPAVRSSTPSDVSSGFTSQTFTTIDSQFVGVEWTQSFFVTNSDIRIKEDMQDINEDDTLNKLFAIEPKTYKYIDKITRGNKKG
jgi:hypothetical protein